MAGRTPGLRGLLERLTSDDGLPERDPLPRHLAPVPRSVENLGLRLAPLVVLIDLLGTAFGFYYYHEQLLSTPVWLWPLVPDSPLATLFAAGAFGAWALGRPQDWLTALALVGNVVLGLWTPIVLVVFRPAFLAGVSEPMFQFLLWSHLAMVVQAFVLHRIGDFSARAVGVAVAYYGANLLVDYFVPIAGRHGHHATLPVPPNREVGLGATAHDVAAASDVLLTLLAVSLAFAIGAAKRRVQLRGAR